MFASPIANIETSMSSKYLGLAAITLTVATSGTVVAETWEKIHDGQITYDNQSEILGSNEIYIDSDSIQREGERARYRIRVVSIILGVRSDTEVQRVSTCSNNRFHRIKVTDRQTGQSSAPRDQGWRDAAPPFNDKIQTRVCN